MAKFITVTETNEETKMSINIEDISLVEDVEPGAKVTLKTIRNGRHIVIDTREKYHEVMNKINNAPEIL